jgi:hypothetical protein
MVILIRWAESEKKDARLLLPENEPDFRIDGLEEIPSLIRKANSKGAGHA